MARPYRYENCHEDCTVDCGHCKGQGPPIDWTDDPTILLDGQRCVECGGVLVAEPVELFEPTTVRCRDCGGVA